jgi:hypothetical protein
MSEWEYTESAIEPIFIEFPPVDGVIEWLEETTEVTVGTYDRDRGRRGLFWLDELKRAHEGAFADQTKVVFEDYEIIGAGSYNNIVRKLQKVGVIVC